MVAPGKTFQLSLLFVGKARSLPLIEEPEVFHFGRLLQTLNYPRKAFLVQKSATYGRQRFYSNGPGILKLITTGTDFGLL